MVSCDSHDLRWTHPVQCPEQLGHEFHQIFQIGCSPAKHDQRNLPTAQALLLRQVLIHRNQDFEPGLVRSLQQFSVREAAQSGIATRLTFMTFEVMTECLVDALVQQYPH